MTHTSSRGGPPRCRWCGKVIRWVKTEAGKSMPIDPDPHPGGNVSVPHDGGAVTVYAKGAPPVIGATRHMPHFATCSKYPRRKGK